MNQIIGEPEGRLSTWISSHAEMSGDDVPQALIDMVVGLFSAPSMARLAGDGGGSESRRRDRSQYADV